MNEIAIKDMGELNTVAMTVAKSGLFGAKTPEQAFVAIATGMELGLKPMQSLRNIVVVQGRPTFSADGGFAVVRNHPEYGGIVWDKCDATEARCRITRVSKGGALKEEFVGAFTMKDAAAAGLANKDNWKHYPARMLRARALSYACRDAFPDVLNGLYAPDEINPDVKVDERPIEAEVVRDVPHQVQLVADAVQGEVMPEVKGGPTTKEEKAVIKKLLTSEYDDGRKIFSREEMLAFNALRKMDAPAPGPMTAGELIDYISKEIKERVILDANTVQE